MSKRVVLKATIDRVEEGLAVVAIVVVAVVTKTAVSSNRTAASQPVSRLAVHRPLVVRLAATPVVVDMPFQPIAVRLSPDFWPSVWQPCQAGHPKVHIFLPWPVDINYGRAIVPSYTT